MIPAAWYDLLPPIVFGLALFGLLLALAELGYHAWGWLGRQSGDRDTGDETQLLSAALVLLALLLGFTFSMALSRYEDRRTQVVAEANDIGTAWLRAGLAGPAGTPLQATLADYARLRIRTLDGIAHPRDYAEQRRKGGAMRQRIWREATVAVAPLGSSAQGAALIAAVNAVIDRGSSRDAAIEARVPEHVLTLLIVYAGVCALLLGYVMGAFGNRHRVASSLLFVLLALTIGLILDLDRPLSGGIRVSQQPLIDLVADIGG